jgi:sulfur transfer complex TusBCD TusB component (DsrH family)
MPAGSEAAVWLPWAGTALDLVATAFRLILEELFSLNDDLSARTTSVKIADSVEKATMSTVLRFTDRFLLASAKIDEMRA